MEARVSGNLRGRRKREPVPLANVILAFFILRWNTASRAVSNRLRGKNFFSGGLSKRQ